MIAGVIGSLTRARVGAREAPSLFSRFHLILLGHSAVGRILDEEPFERWHSKQSSNSIRLIRIFKRTIAFYIFILHSLLIQLYYLRPKYKNSFIRMSNVRLANYYFFEVEFQLAMKANRIKR